jgi:putative transposase
MAEDSKKGAKTRARIGFSDESAFSDKPTVRKTWAPKGHTPILKVPGGWITRSVISLLTCSPKGLQPRLYFETLKGAVNADTFVGFLKGVKRHTRGTKLILIIDNLRVHKARAVNEHLRQEKRWLTVEYLPPYAPELNPVEYVWSSRKRKEFGNAIIANSRILDRRIRKSGEQARGDPALLKGFLKASTLFK